MNPQTIFIIEALILGLAIGSFLNVLIYRLPLEKTMAGRSLCPGCNQQIPAYDNIPVISYLILGGKCRRCKSKIGIRYPAVELITGILSVLTYLKTGKFDTYLIWFLLFMAPLVTITFIDIDHQIIPNVISLPGILVGTAATLYLQWPNYWTALQFSGLGILAGGGSLLAIAGLYYLIRKREGMGMGDVKLCAMLGAFLGYRAIIFIFLVSSALALIFAIISFAIPRKKLEGTTALPFGPFLSLAAIIYFFYGVEILDWYFARMGLVYHS